MDGLNKPYIVDAGKGEDVWFLNTLITIKAGAKETGGAFSWLEQLCPAGFAPPRHVHYAETEAFYMLEGTMTLSCGDLERDVEPGDFALLPRGIPHGFVVPSTGPARFIHLTAPGRFDHFVRELGEPATAPVIPEPTEPDMDTLFATLERYDFDLLSE